MFIEDEVTPIFDEKPRTTKNLPPLTPKSTANQQTLQNTALTPLASTKSVANFSKAPLRQPKVDTVN